MMEAVSRNGGLLVHAPPWLRSDREVALAAVRQDASAIHFLSAHLQADDEILTTAGQSRCTSRSESGARSEFSGRSSGSSPASVSPRSVAEPRERMVKCIEFQPDEVVAL